MSKKAPFTKDHVLNLLEDNFAQAETVEGRLQISDYNKTYETIAGPVQAYVMAIMADEKESPLFQFCSTKNFTDLSRGEEKWIGFIPWMLDDRATRAYANTACKRLASDEMDRLSLDPHCINKLQNLIQNGLISILHNNIKAAKDIATVNPNIQNKRGEVMAHISYQRVKDVATEAKIESRGTKQNPLTILLEKLGAISLNDTESEKTALLGEIERTKLDAVRLYQDLGDAIMQGQKEAGIEGDFAAIDLRIEDPWEPYFDLLKKAFGLNGPISEGGKDEYEAQAIAHLTYLLMRLRSHPVMKACEQNSPILNKKFIKDFYRRIGAIPENKRPKKIGIQKNGSPASAMEDVHNYVNLDCYETTLEGFEDLELEKKEILRGGFRLKDEISILIKTLIKKQMLKDITDIDAGECVTINISESDLENSPDKDRLADFMTELARQSALSFGNNLIEADHNIPYGKLARGTFKIENKLKKDPKNAESFNFPAVKAYLNIPVEDPTNPEASIRVEFRVLCGDTYIRGAHDDNSRSNHSHYKRKQAIELLRIITPRAYKAQIHQVAIEHKKWSKKQERLELEDLRDRRKSGRDKIIILPQLELAQ